MLSVLRAPQTGRAYFSNTCARYFSSMGACVTLQADPAAGLGYLIGSSEMGRWLFIGLLALAIGALAGCAATGPLSEPCWGFFACTGWH